jgi:hypothetical protein
MSFSQNPQRYSMPDGFVVVQTRRLASRHINDVAQPRRQVPRPMNGVEVEAITRFISHTSTCTICLAVTGSSDYDTRVFCNIGKAWADNLSSLIRLVMRRDNTPRGYTTTRLERVESVQNSQCLNVPITLDGIKHLHFLRQYVS